MSEGSYTGYLFTYGDVSIYRVSKNFENLMFWYSTRPGLDENHQYGPGLDFDVRRVPGYDDTKDMVWRKVTPFDRSYHRQIIAELIDLLSSVQKIALALSDLEPMAVG